ncbi:hypothetical protein Kpol_530p9 [Vanderwaltozyma polyspora DSM 70294]|uniref:YEATS domain-containing protein n=1 Tax=Vanderwaltozyma polyspora (strain ATCC 22028 / DSM 70294 / BCRC 21397 / CBS 2163 / NBRC 10782 / NRRL Y-8283 / UCD 57-17) TaxID=436907 RepID=A7TKY3_VANPO|nr:uncharacterized protein Kpol_530p9 [Vanderwaltozyma polyspora DSM 70294]EDO17039.1 hypothetical protein Kpol_530p9 [Vanderwaltozyma polyspora DSM 70294]
MVATTKRTVRIKTTQHVLPDLPPVENFPMRKWAIEIFVLDADGKEITATLFDKVVYHLHPTFANPNRTFTEPPFKIEEQGWGGFALNISLFLLEKGGERKVVHDLNFIKEEYQVDHVIQVPLNKPLLRTELAKSGHVEEPPTKRKNESTTSTTEPKPKKGKASVTPTVKGSVDIQQLAFSLTKLKEDDLVTIVQMITDNRTPEMDVVNNVEDGEFVIDLFSLPEGLLKSLWEYITKNTE